MARGMVDSGQVWLGQIPKGWNIGKIGGLYKLRNTKVSDKDYPALSVTKNGIVPQLETAAKTNDGDNRKLVRIGDFAINSRSDRRGSCGISPYDGSVSLIVTVLEPREEMNPRYYDWLFHTKEFADEFYANGRGIVDDLWTTNWQNMKRISVVVPPLPEQQKIAAFLDDKCAEIDSLIADIQREIDKLERLRQLIITEAVTKGIDNSPELIDSGVDWIGKIPKGWKIMHFKYCAKIKSNLVSPEKFSDYPQISPDSIEKNTGKIIDSKTVEESGIISDNHLFYEGQIIYSKIRPTLNKVIIAPFDGLCSADMYPIEAFCNTKFLFYTMLSNYFVSQVGLVTQNRVKMPKINQEELGVIIVTIPNEDEQQKIANYLDARCAEFETILSEKQKQIEILQKLKKSVIYEYVTGKKEVK